MITLVTVLLVVAVFLRALGGFLATRDPMQRDITLIFLPSVAVCVNALVREVNGGPLPLAVNATATALLMLQPYLTLRLTARLRHVPTWLDRLVQRTLAKRPDERFSTAGDLGRALVPSAPTEVVSPGRAERSIAQASWWVRSASG